MNHHSIRLTFLVFILLNFTFQSATFGQQEIQTIKKNPFTIGETVRVKSTILNEVRVLNIYLPQSYSQDSVKKYPVIYLLDGSGDEDFIHIVGLVQFGSFSWINMIPETIVVGLGNVDRKRDFTYPSHNELDNKEVPTSGKSEAFVSFIGKELQPFIDSNYRTTNIKTIIGQSLGGLLATEILLKQPDLFDNYIIVSPSLWWDNESLLQLKPKEYHSEKSIYIAVGNEGEVMTRTAKELYTKLTELNSKNTHLYFKYLEEQDHGDALHLAVYDAFEKMFRIKKE